MTNRPAAVRAVGAFCPQCGASIKRMTRAELLMLGALRQIYDEYAATMKERGRGLAAFAPAARRDVLTKYSGLHEATVLDLLGRLSSLGYIEVRKAYARRHNLYRFSERAMNDVYLHNLIDIALGKE